MNYYFFKCFTVNLIDNGTVTRLKCQRLYNTEENSQINETVKAKNAIERFKNDTLDEHATVKLEQDRVFHTCHILPTTVRK